MIEVRWDEYLDRYWWWVGMVPFPSWAKADAFVTKARKVRRFTRG